jgi:Spy/CpxP family protein refolding chaperone
MKRGSNIRNIALVSVVAGSLLAATALEAGAQGRGGCCGRGMGFQKAAGVCDGSGPHGMRGHRMGGRGAFMGRGGGFMGHGGGILERALRLDLTEDQEAKLREIRSGAPGALMPKQQAVIEARMAFHDLMARDDADAAALERAHDDLLDAQKQMQAAHFELRMQVREVLTPEQREELQKERRGDRQPMGRRSGRRAW